MPYERFHKALEEFQRLMKSGAADPDALEECSAELFDSLFDHFPWGPGMRGFGEEYRDSWKDTRERILGNLEEDVVEEEAVAENGYREIYTRLGIAPHVATDLPKHITARIYKQFERELIKKTQGYLFVHIGAYRYLTGHPNPPLSDEMLHALKQLTLPDVSYQPDQEDSRAELATAIRIKGAILLITWLLCGYGDDLQPTHGELKNLIARYRRSGLAGSNSRFLIHSLLILSLSRRIDAELKFQQGNYASALVDIANSIAAPRKSSEIFQLSGNPITPWLSDAENLAMDCIANTEQAPGANTDWSAVADACELLSKCSYAYSDYEIAYISDTIELDDIGGTDYTFWIEKSGWARAQMTPDRLRTLLRDQNDELAVQRLKTYFFADDLWEKLSERAQSALVTADRMMTSATYARYSGIANEVRIATEEVFYHCLWIPLDKWADKNQSDSTRLRFVLDAPEQSRRSPSISDYITLLEHSDTKAYFRSIGLSDDDVRFLTKDKRTIKNLKALRDLRNKAEHNPNPAIGPDSIRALYKRFLGIGCKGVLPELLRLLTAAPRDAS